MCFCLKNRSYNLLRPLPPTAVFENGYALPVCDYGIKITQFQVWDRLDLMVQ